MAKLRMSSNLGLKWWMMKHPHTLLKTNYAIEVWQDKKSI